MQQNTFKQTEVGKYPEEWHLVKVGDVSKKTRDVLVEKDTINLSCNVCTVFDKMQAQLKRNLARLGYEC